MSTIRSEQKEYVKLRNDAREFLAGSTLRVNYLTGATHGIYIGDQGPVKGVVNFVDESGMADFILSYDDGKRMLAPYEQIIPAWITALQGRLSGKDVLSTLEKLDHDGISDNQKFTIGRRELLNRMVSRRLIASKTTHLGQLYRLSPLGTYLFRATDIWR